MSVDVVCGKCGAKIANMRMLKSVKDVMRPYNSKCPSCGQTLSHPNLQWMYRKTDLKIIPYRSNSVKNLNY